MIPLSNNKNQRESFMKKLILALAITLTSFSANAIFLQNCHNTSWGNDAVSFSYQSCLNRNFREIERATPGSLFLQHCSNFGSQVSYFFESCVNNNFRSIERAIDNPIFLSLCHNFSRDRLDFAFESCVNRNFSTVERELR